MKTDNLTGISYPEADDDYAIFEDFSISLMRYNYINNLKLMMKPSKLDSTNLTYTSGDFFAWTENIIIIHPISAKRITISKSFEFPLSKEIRIRDGSVIGITIPVLMNDNMDIALQEKTSLARDDYSFLVLGVRYGNELHLTNGNVVNV